ncbi:MAG: FUSC family protein [Chloroflexi bacterium]|nr:FUSC family protein [Chloroflexota bacterium]MBV9600511.1 FUSC family protein [Chloroflexota bacterium]
MTLAESRRWHWLTHAPGLLLESVHDPGYASLRRGLRAGVVVPSLLGFATIMDLGRAFSTFLVFGAMALLVFADFGGKTRDRLLAYVLTALAGIVLIVIGTLASVSLPLAVGVAAVVAFGVAGLGILGGYYLSAQMALLLAVVLSVTSPAGIDALPTRIAGWSTAGIAAVLAAWLLWPRSGHVALRATAASVIRAVADTIAAPNQATPRLESAARQQLAVLQRGFVVAQRRPSGATRRDRALAELAPELSRALTFAESATAVESTVVVDDERVLQAAVVRALHASADLLEGGGDAHDIEPLVAARDAHRTALDRWAAEQLQAGATPESVLDGLSASYPMRRMSFMVLSIAQNAEVVAGLPPTGPDQVATRRGVWSTFWEELTPASIALRNTLRTSLAVTLAVLVTGLLGLSFAFWVVLGTLSALRSNASATGRTALQAVSGTAVGVLIAMPFVGVTGSEPWVLWIVLPILVFLAAYTPAAVHFVVGQAAFSMLVVVIFNILAPADWQIGFVRLQNAALGVGISALVALMLWPRGARGQLRDAVASLYDAGAGSLSFSFRQMLVDNSADSDDGAAEDAHDLAHTQAIRAQEVFELFLHERGRQSPAIEVWATLLSGGKHFRLIGEVIDSLTARDYRAAEAGPPAHVVGRVAGDAVDSIVRMAAEIRSGRALRVTEPDDASMELRNAALAGLSAAATAASPEALRSAIGLASSADWIGQLESLLHDLETPVAETLAASRMPWWR